MQAVVRLVKRDWFLPILIVVVIGIACNAVYSMTKDRSETVPVAREGVIDLSNWDFARLGSVPLNGQWTFYPNQLLKPDQLPGSSAPTRYIRVPGLWTAADGDGEKAMGGQGYATYRLIVKVSDTEMFYAIRANVVFMSSRLFVDGKEAGGAGKPDTGKASYVSQNVPYSAAFSPDSREIEIVMQIANFDHYAGGIGVPLYLGYQQDITLSSLRDSGLQMGSAMVLLVFGLFFLVLFALYIRDASLLLIALFFLFFAGNILVNGEKLFLQFFGRIGFELAWACKNFTIYISVPILYMLTAKLYGSLRFRWLLTVPAAIVGLYCAAIVTLPYSQYIAFEKPVMYALLLFHGLLFVLLAIHYGQRGYGDQHREELRFYTASMLVLLVYRLYNILYVRYYVPKTWIAPIAVMLFILLIALMLVQRYYRAYAASEELSRQLRAADKRKDEFLQRTSVELKTPIQRILNLTEELAEEGRRGAGAEAFGTKVKMVGHTALRMSHMVDDLVDLVKIRDNQLSVNARTVDVGACVSMVFQVFGFVAEGKRIRLRRELDNDARCVIADEGRLMQVLYHLVDNGLKHLEQGRLTVSSRKVGDRIEIAVVTAGAGLRPEDRDIILRAADRRAQTEDLDSRGLGWSLSVAEKLIGLMNGTLRLVWSERNTDCRYEITLPAGEPDRRPLPVAVEDDEEGGGGYRGNDADLAGGERRNGSFVLVIAEDAVMLEILLHLLAMEGYRVAAARSRDEAMRRIEGPGRPDLVLLDVMADGGSGYETAQAVRRLYSSIELPILFIAARNTPADVEAGLEAGGDDYITKPIDAGEVRARIRTLLAMKKWAREAAANEMAFLQSQIKPHFLYNALGTIMSLCYTDGRKAGKMIGVLSSYLRMLFQFDNREQTITLRKELELIGAYTAIEKERFGDRLEFQMRADPALLECPIAPLTLQPLVENAIRHGVLKKPTGGRVALTIERDADHMKVTVEDDGVGMSPEKKEEVLGRTSTSKGVGLASIRKRVSRATEKPFLLESFEGRGTTVTLWLPLRP
jgi:signal transduction histidine kinase